MSCRDLEVAVFYLNEVLSIRAQEWVRIIGGHRVEKHLNEVLSIRAQEWAPTYLK